MLRIRNMLKGLLKTCCNIAVGFGVLNFIAVLQIEYPQGSGVRKQNLSTAQCATVQSANFKRPQGGTLRTRSKVRAQRLILSKVRDALVGTKGGGGAPPSAKGIRSEQLCIPVTIPIDAVAGAF
jgi:hypothetical protein